MHLPDIHGLIALVGSHHPYHNRAKPWFHQQRTGPWLTWALTRLGFCGFLVIWPFQVRIPRWSKLHGYNKTTDVYLGALPEQHKATLVTSDQGLKSSGRAVVVPND